MAHTWKHKQEQKAISRFKRAKKFVKNQKQGPMTIDLGELLDAGYDIEGLYKGTSMAEIEKRLGKKKF